MSEHPAGAAALLEPPPAAPPAIPPAERDERAGARRGAGGLLLSAAVLALAAGLVALVPHVAGTSWGAVRDVVAGVPPLAVAGLVLLWAAGLWSYSWVLTAALPGLSRRRALLLNLSGSAVSNVLPLGGAAGVALNAAMTTSWGCTRRQTASFTVVSNVVDVAGKLVVSGAVLAACLLGARAAGDVPLPGLGALLAACTALALVGACLLGSSRLAALLGRALGAAGRGLASVHTRLRPDRPAAAPAAPDLVAFRRDVVAALRRRWAPLTGGVLGYLLLQGLLLAGCLAAGGAAAAPVVVLAAFAVDRLATLLPLTPSGTGFAEAGAAAVLVAGGVPAPAAVAGVLLYRALVVLLEIPVGGAALAGWLLLRRARRAAAAPVRRVAA